MCRDVCSTVQDDVFFFNDTATTEIYTLSLHDALPILIVLGLPNAFGVLQIRHRLGPFYIPAPPGMWTDTPRASTRSYAPETRSARRSPTAARPAFPARGSASFRWCPPRRPGYVRSHRRGRSLALGSSP